MISRCWRHWSNILEMEVRGRLHWLGLLHLWLGIEERVVGQSVAVLSGVLRALEHECGVWKVKTSETGEADSGP